MKSMILFLIYLFSLNCFAVDGYVIPAAGSEDIDEHGDCQQIVNTATNDIFVPTKTNTEWQSFQSNKPTFITVNTCPAAGGTWNAGEACNGSVAPACPGGVAPAGACSPVGSMCSIVYFPEFYCSCTAAYITYTCQ